MALGLRVRASFAAGPPDDPLGAVAAWAASALPAARVATGGGGDAPTLRLALHPAAEDVEVTLEESGQLVLSAATSAAGPGYHAFVVEEVLDPLARALALRWESRDDEGDETGYLEGRDRDELERQMLAWLRALAATLVREGAADPDEQFDVCLPLGAGFQMPAFARTPLGPRDRAWFEAVAEDPRRGTGFFAWWDPGQGAGYWHGLALALAWTEARWCAPERAEDEEVLRRIADALARAHALDPSRPYPWRAWGEVLELLEERGALADEVRARAAGSAEAPLGYRRHPVRVALAGGWSMRLPGALCEDRDEEGAWWAHGEGREAWFSAFSRRAPEARGGDAERLLADLTKHGAARTFVEQAEGRAAAAALREADGTWILASMVEVPGRLALATFVLPAGDDVDWALDAWRSLRHAGGA